MRAPVRLIPAHAGKTSAATTAPARRTAHPRSRGENSANRRSVVDHEGSSPLTRGKPRGSVGSRGRSGLIPAHAGKTSSTSNEFLTRRAHPRSRGENDDPQAWEDYDVGSSPLTRGKLDAACAGNIEARLIPAHAGKTRNESAQLTKVRAHPRSRGENIGGHIDEAAARGSSPLTRGKRCAHGE